jgi:hypothetical protein
MCVGQPRKSHTSRRPKLCRRRQPPTLLQPELDIKMRARQEAKLQELRVMQSEQQHKELERKYAVRYHKASAAAAVHINLTSSTLLKGVLRPDAGPLLRARETGAPAAEVAEPACGCSR